MHCAYCGVDYEENETCLCLPPVRATELQPFVKADCAWGEADVTWSVRERSVPVAPFINMV